MKPRVQDSDPEFPPLTERMLPVSAACVSSSVEGTTELERSGPTDRVELGPGKIFRPTKGLCALFLRTGTKRKPRCTPKPPPSPSSSQRRSFADVVREGKDMARQGSGNGGNFGEHGGGRGIGFNPSFNPGYDPGFGGRGEVTASRGEGVVVQTVALPRIGPRQVRGLQQLGWKK